MRKRTTRVTCVALPLAVGVFVAAAASLPASSASDPNTKVEIDDFAFSPQQITVRAGTTVMWTNEDDAPHTVASSTKLFKSNALDTDASFSFTFTTPGVYEYFCSLHPHMTGTVVVEGSSGSSAAQ
jgi:plastocyanin